MARRALGRIATVAACFAIGACGQPSAPASEPAATPPPAEAPAAATTAAAQPAPAAASTMDQRIGWIDDSCLGIANGTLTPGTVLTIYTFEASAAVVEGRVLSRADSPETCPPLRPERRDSNSAAGRVFYRIEVPDVPKLSMGVAAVGGAVVGGTNMDATGDGKPEQFSNCATTEGIAFGVWASAPYKSEQLWSGYDYLGYDLQPNCPK